tara:strand:+ start:102 stop:218 length:117 start_codon:yes stop_codon:yes gene_type:complete
MMATIAPMTHVIRKRVVRSQQMQMTVTTAMHAPRVMVA